MLEYHITTCPAFHRSAHVRKKKGNRKELEKENGLTTSKT